jgi:hypothetical protein
MIYMLLQCNAINSTLQPSSQHFLASSGAGSNSIELEVSPVEQKN